VAAPPGDVIAACEILTSPETLLRQVSGEADRRGGSNSETVDRVEPFEIPFGAMINHEWHRDDVHALSHSFDLALAQAAIDEIKRLAHMWLISEPPQVIEPRTGRRVGDELIATVERRVIQLRRADDYITGADSHDLIRNELSATVQLLTDGALTDVQANRLLTAIGELAQLGAWVAADSGMLDRAARYVRGGILAARAAGDYADSPDSVPRPAVKRRNEPRSPVGRQKGYRRQPQPSALANLLKCGLKCGLEALRPPDRPARCGGLLPDLRKVASQLVQLGASLGSKRRTNALLQLTKRQPTGSRVLPQHFHDHIALAVRGAHRTGHRRRPFRFASHRSSHQRAGIKRAAIN
jgi:hypothetical protein